jgi:hypothetical protein
MRTLDREALMSARDRRRGGAPTRVPQRRGAASAGVKPPPSPVNQPDGTGDPSLPPQGERLERPGRRRKESS